MALASSRSAAAASAEPPPTPAANRQHLVKRETSNLQIGHALAQELRADLEHEVVGNLAAILGKRATDLKSELSSDVKAQAIGAICESDHTFEFVEAIDAPSNHPKGQVDFGTAAFNQLRRTRSANRFSSSPGRHSEC